MSTPKPSPDPDADALRSEDESARAQAREVIEKYDRADPADMMGLFLTWYSVRNRVEDAIKEKATPQQRDGIITA